MMWILRVLSGIPPVQWISVALGLLSLSREIFRWMAEHEKTTREKAKKIHQFKTAVRKARHENDTSDIMRHFAELGIMHGVSDPAKPVCAEDIQDNL